MYRYTERPTKSGVWRSWLVPLWLMGVSAGPVIPVQEQITAAVQGALLTWPLLIMPFTLTRALPGFKESPAAIFFFTAFSIGAAFSAAMSVDPLYSTMSLCALVTAVCLACSIWNISAKCVTSGIATYAVCGSLLAIGALVVLRPESGRLNTLFHANEWGAMAYGRVAASLFIKRPLVRWGVIFVNLFVIGWAESRSALLAAVLCYLTYTFIAIFGEQQSKAILCMAGIVLVALVYFLVASPAILADFAEQSFKYNDPSRGMGSGFTGRDALWQDALQIFATHQTLGVGPRLGERYMVSGLSTHNGYLQVLMECGVVGGLFLFPFLIILLVKAWRNAVQGSHRHRVSFALGVAYCVAAMFEARILNAGNPTSLLTWVFLLAPAADVARGPLYQVSERFRRRALPPSYAFHRPRMADGHR